jgi:hypothetical protein
MILLSDADRDCNTCQWRMRCCITQGMRLYHRVQLLRYQYYTPMTAGGRG